MFRTVRPPASGAALVCGILFALLFTSAALAQPVAGTSQPDHLTLGTLRVGATAEASLRFFFAGDDTAGLQVIAQPPPFARITQTRLSTETYGNLGTFVVCDVILALDTTRAGELRGEVRIAIGDQVAEAPVAASLLPDEPGLSRVLLVETPFERFATNDASLFKPWLELVKTARLSPSYLEVEPGGPVLRNLDLAKFDVVLLSGTGLFYATPADFQKLSAFVQAGGRVVVAANHFFQGTVGKANEFTVPFGLRMNDEEPRESGAITVEQVDIVPHRFSNGVKTHKFFRPSPIAVEDPAQAELLIVAPPFPDHGFAAVARSGQGEVVLLGASLWWNWLSSEQTSDADNAVWLGNVLRNVRERK
ncbi:MAG: hypothetical protein ACKV0T_16615 [Planctomycetales bacterium]